MLDNRFEATFAGLPRFTVVTRFAFLADSGFVLISAEFVVFGEKTVESLRWLVPRVGLVCRFLYAGSVVLCKPITPQRVFSIFFEVSGGKC